MSKTEQQKCVRARQATCQILAAVQPIGLRVKYIEKVSRELVWCLLKLRRTKRRE